MEEIAAEAGIARSTLYVYFPTRELLLQAALQSMREELDLELAAREGGEDPIERLRGIIESLVVVVDRDVKFFRLVLAAETQATVEGAALGALLATIGLSVNDAVTEILVSGEAQGLFAPGAQNAADLIGQQIYGAIAVRAGEPLPRPRAEAAADIVGFILHGLAA